MRTLLGLLPVFSVLVLPILVLGGCQSGNPGNVTAATAAATPGTSFSPALTPGATFGPANVPAVGFSGVQNPPHSTGAQGLPAGPSTAGLRGLRGPRGLRGLRGPTPERYGRGGRAVRRTTPGPGLATPLGTYNGITGTGNLTLGPVATHFNTTNSAIYVGPAGALPPIGTHIPQPVIPHGTSYWNPGESTVTYDPVKGTFNWW